jgi:hypothetical protein
MGRERNKNYPSSLLFLYTYLFFGPNVALAFPVDCRSKLWPNIMIFWFLVVAVYPSCSVWKDGQAYVSESVSSAINKTVLLFSNYLRA